MPKTPFLGLSLLPNPKETLSTQAKYKTKQYNVSVIGQKNPPCKPVTIDFNLPFFYNDTFFALLII